MKELSLFSLFCFVFLFFFVSDEVLKRPFSF